MTITLFHFRVGRYFVTAWWAKSKWLPEGRFMRMTDALVENHGTKPFIKLHDFMRVYK